MSNKSKLKAGRRVVLELVSLQSKGITISDIVRKLRLIQFSHPIKITHAPLMVRHWRWNNHRSRHLISCISLHVRHLLFFSLISTNWGTNSHCATSQRLKYLHLGRRGLSLRSERKKALASEMERALIPPALRLCLSQPAARLVKNYARPKNLKTSINWNKKRGLMSHAKTSRLL